MGMGRSGIEQVVSRTFLILMLQLASKFDIEFIRFKNLSCNITLSAELKKIIFDLLAKASLAHNNLFGYKEVFDALIFLVFGRHIDQKPRSFLLIK